MLQAEVARIDPGKKTVVVGVQTLSYDYLIISLGADLAPESVPGLKEEAHIFYEPSGAQGLLEAARAFSGGRVALLVAATPFKCPAAPYEAAMLLDDFLKRRVFTRSVRSRSTPPSRFRCRWLDRRSEMP